MVQRRIYKQGRSTAGWTRGKRILDIAEIKTGDVVIAVNDQFKSENLIVFVRRPNGTWRQTDRFVRDFDDFFQHINRPKYAAYANASNGKRTGQTDGNNGSLFCYWHWELGSGMAQRLYKAIKTPQKIVTRETLKQWAAKHKGRHARVSRQEIMDMALQLELP
jgi:hypothetical protein